MSKFFIKKTSAASLLEDIRAGMEWIGYKNLIKSGSKVVLKPNYTYPGYKEGVTTSTPVLEAVVRALKDLTNDITIVESDGGNKAWPTETAFKNHCLFDLQKKYGIKLVNLTKSPLRTVEIKIGRRTVKIELPVLLLDQVDAFITLPVPKIHMMTRYTGAIKNQWGCIPGVMRLYYHSDFSEIINAINKLFKIKMAVFDGTFMLNRSGPMFGDSIKMDIVAVTDDHAAGDLVMTNIMGIREANLEHFNVAKKKGIMPKDLSGVTFNDDISKFKTVKFYLKRTLHNYGALVLFKSRIANQIFYGTFVSKFLQRINKLIKGNKFKIEQY
ncbi:MAG: DUF362 domain-containing protein [Candidatus Margulisiibacteriota bacterium]